MVPMVHSKQSKRGSKQCAWIWEIKDVQASKHQPRRGSQDLRENCVEKKRCQSCAG
jgi:hypothetical protein